MMGNWMNEAIVCDELVDSIIPQELAQSLSAASTKRARDKILAGPARTFLGL